MKKIAYMSDIFDLEDGSIEMEVIDKYGEVLLIPIDLERLGLNKEMDFEFTLGKDICRIVETYTRNNRKTPSISYITKNLYKKNYVIIDLGGV